MNKADNTLSTLKTLADGVRLNIVRTLAASPNDQSPGCDLATSCSSLFKVSQPTMSHHLAKLVETGVLSESKDGTSKSYKLNRQHLLSLGINVEKL